MFRFAIPRLFVAFTATEPGAPAAPASTPAAPNPGSGQPEGFNDAQAAASARLDAAFPQGVQPGAPADVAAAAAAPPAEAPAFDIWADDADESMIPADMPYADGVKLRNEIKAAREQFRPFRDAFGNMDEAERQQFLAAAPTVGADLSTFAQVAPYLHQDDRTYMMRVMELMATDPAQAGQLMAEAAEILRGSGAPPAAPAAAAAVPGAPEIPAEMDPAAAPLTVADFNRMMAERDSQQQVDHAVGEVTAKARELGYDPDATDPVDRTRFNTFIGLAATPEVGGDLDRAHELMQAADQAVIDRFVSAKAADADRPGVPAMGTALADTQVLETLADARGASEARLTAALGPDPRKRED